VIWDVAIGDSGVKVETKRNEKRCRKGKHQRKVQKYSNAMRRDGWEKWRKEGNKNIGIYEDARTRKH
jgi:hypothetical protein